MPDLGRKWVRPMPLIPVRHPGNRGRHGAAQKWCFCRANEVAAERIGTAALRRPLETWEYAGLAGIPTTPWSRSAFRRQVVHRNRRSGGGNVSRILLRAPRGRASGRDQRRLSYSSSPVCGAAASACASFIGKWWPPRRCTSTASKSSPAGAAARTAIIRGRDSASRASCPRGLRAMLPLGLAEEQTTILDLMGCPRGRAWWREDGVTIGAAFRSAGRQPVAGAFWTNTYRAKMNAAKWPQKEILKSARQCCMVTLDDDARHNTRQREESGPAPVDHGGDAGRGAAARFLRHGGRRVERAGRNDSAHPTDGGEGGKVGTRGSGARHFVWLNMTGENACPPKNNWYQAGPAFGPVFARAHREPIAVPSGLFLLRAHERERNDGHVAGVLEVPNKTGD